MNYRFLKNSALTRVNDAHCSGKSSSKKMASTGQTSAQTPQSMHSSGLMKYWSASSVEWMQSTGQTSTQEASFVPMHGWVMTYVIARSSSHVVGRPILGENCAWPTDSRSTLAVGELAGPVS